MNYLSIEQVCKRYGERELLVDASFGINKGQKVALVAKNGTGKSTLLKMIAGEDEPDTGRIVFRNGIKVGILHQDPILDGELSIKEEIYNSENEAVVLLKKFKTLSVQGYSEEVEQIQEALNRLGGWDYDAKIDAILSKLGLIDLEQKTKSLSGGQKKRLALAKILIEPPDFLILDEPTNHLDLDMIEWLENYMAKQDMTLLMVTHDRYFLDRVCDEIIELDNKQIHRYKGDYSYYLEKKQERIEVSKSEIEKAKNLYSKELDWMRRQPKARSTKAKYRVDAFDEVKQKAKSSVDEKSLSMEINVNRLGGKIIELHKVGKSFANKILIDNFSYVFKKNDKIGIIGPNGSGKTTMLNIITGELEADKGKVVRGDTLVLGHYKQEGFKESKDHKKVIEVITEIAEFIPLAKGAKVTAVQLLERFLFPRSMHYQNVSKLSGGEKRRLYLLTILMGNPNFLILDEPTNDLDILTLNVLEDFLADFGGCLLIVSHDRFFMDKLVEHMFVFEGEGLLSDFPGNYTQWREKKILKDREEAKKLKAEKEKSVVSKVVTTNKQEKKLTYKEKLEFEGLEQEIADLETEKDELNEKLNSAATNYEEIEKISQRLSEVLGLIEEKEFRWLELADKQGS